MPNNLLKKWNGSHLSLIFITLLIFSGVLAYFRWQIGLLSFIVIFLLLFITIRAKKQLEKEFNEYVVTLSYRVNKAGEEAFNNLPIGMILYNDQNQFQWVNPYISSLFDEELIGNLMEDHFPQLKDQLEKNKNELQFSFEEKVFKIIHIEDERLLYFFDITEELFLKDQYERGRTVIGYLYLDNYDEVTQGMDDQTKSSLLTHVATSLNQWAKKYDIFVRRTASDRFLAIFNEEILDILENDRFTILDSVREETAQEHVALTISFGIGTKASTLQELGALAQSSLDLALVRGGDQVAIKGVDGKVRFYGGKSNAIEKRTRVRARVISHSIHDFINESDKVIIMGHKNPDLDAIGASVGMLKIAEANGKNGYIVIDPTDINSSVKSMLNAMKEQESLWDKFITPEKAIEIADQKSLLFIVDTHRPSLVIEPKLLDIIDRMIVIDHHRRGEEFIEKAVLVYMEPYASSASELVTELIEYQPKQPKLNVLESTALLSGIILDTNSFAIRTGSRTFDAASFLKSKGADTTLVQRFMKEDLPQYIKRSKLLEKAYIYSNGMAIAKGTDEDSYDQLLIAQAADTLLTMNSVVGSFVISQLKDGNISISARSLGEVNVQVIMEALGGGGHLTNAATQLTDMGMDEAEQQLQEKIDDYFKGGESL